MYIAMNRFRVKRGHEDEFETVWTTRERHLKTVPGFQAFHLLRGGKQEDHTLYASHTIWADYDAFVGWTKSQQFRDAHKNAGQNSHMYLGGPNFEGFEVILEETL